MNEKKPVYKKTDIGLNCPSCGQFMGPFKVCPYCRTRVKNRLDIRTFKAISLFVAVVGIAALLVWANMKEHDEWKIGDLTKRQNYAYLEFNGTVVEDARYFYEVSDTGEVLPNSLTFTIDDGTGIMEVKAYSEIAKDLIRENRIPVKGDQVTVKGPVNFRGNDMSLLIQDWEVLEIHRPEPDINVSIADIYSASEGDFESGRMIKLDDSFAGFLVGKELQESDYNVDFFDIYDNAKILIKDGNDNMAVIHVSNALLSANWNAKDKSDGKEISFFDEENSTGIRVSVVGHLIWDEYTSLGGGYYGGSWVIVPQRLDDVWMEAI